MPVAYNPTPIDWSQLAGIGQQLGQGYQRRQLSNDMQGAIDPATGKIDFAKAAAIVTKRDPIMGMKLLVEQQQADALAGYREGQLGIAAANAEPDDLKLWRAYQERYGGGQAEPYRLGAAEPTESTPSGVPGFNLAQAPNAPPAMFDKFRPSAEVTREKEAAKFAEKDAAEIRGKQRGAQTFLNKVGRIKEFISKYGAPDDLFGPLQGREYFAGGQANTGIDLGSLVGTEAAKARQTLRAMISDLELDVARMKLKGQGQVTEAERAIARQTLPQTTNQDAATALGILGNLEYEANELLGNVPAGQGGGASMDMATDPPASFAPEPRTVPIPAPTQAGAAQPPVAAQVQKGSPQERQILQWANEAIQNGADPAAVVQRLREMGIEQ